MVLSARELAFNILLDVDQKGAFSNISMEGHLDGKIRIEESNLVREIVYGVLENELYIDHILRKASKIRIKKIHPKILLILRMGIYQLAFMDRIPSSAAVNESVNLAKKHGHKGSIGFVNGVLRNINRNKEEFMKISVKDRKEYISIKYSHPKWLVERWIDEFGEEFTEKICRANNNTPELNIRVNNLKTNKENLKTSLEKNNLIVREGKYSKDSLIVENPTRITDLEEFKLGHFFIQDESSSLVGQLMNPEPGSLVLDLCSAPGGKATHMAEIMGNRGRVLSRDVYMKKLEIIRENARRLGVEIIETKVEDGRKYNEDLKEVADYLLIDAPCSGFGLIRRKPEIKWNRKEGDIEELVELQYEILDNGKDYLKVGGTMVYSTCTIENDENINLINRFLNENRNFKLVNIENTMENQDNIHTLEKGYIQLYPHIHGTDGFFIAKMIKER